MSERARQDGTVGKAMAVLDRVAAHGRPVRFSELLAELPYPKATLYRILQTLVSQNMLTLDADQGVYAPGIRLVRLAHAAWQTASLGPLAREHIDRLAAEVGETVHLAQLDHGHVLYIDKRQTADLIDIFSDAGRIGPAYCTGVGKAMLAALEAPALEAALAMQSFHRHTQATITGAAALRAELDAIRETGFALDREEHEPGIICIAMAVPGPGGRLIGAVSITSNAARNDLDTLAGLAPRLGRTVAEIAQAARDWRFPEPASLSPMQETKDPKCLV